MPVTVSGPASPNSIMKSTPFWPLTVAVVADSESKMAARSAVGAASPGKVELKRNLRASAGPA